MPAPLVSCRVCTVILNWNQPAMTVDCARTALAQEVPGGQTVVVIDNGSTPENRAALRVSLPGGCVLVQNERNLGFAGGMNTGIRYARRRGYEYVWLLNNDAFPDPGCLAALVAAMDGDTALAACTPQLRFPDGTPQLVAGQCDWETGGLTFLTSGQLPSPTPAGYYATGAALFVRASSLRDIGVFDPRFFAYWEEVDLCVRLVRAGRWNLAIIDGATCVHLEAASTGENLRPIALMLFNRNCWLLLRKHTRCFSWPRLILRLLALQFVRAGNLHARGQSSAANAVLVGMWSGLTGRCSRPRRVEPPQALVWIARHCYWVVGRSLWMLANAISFPGQRRRSTVFDPAIPHEPAPSTGRDAGTAMRSEHRPVSPRPAPAWPDTADLPAARLRNKISPGDQFTGSQAHKPHRTVTVAVDARVMLDEPLRGMGKVAIHTYCALAKVRPDWRFRLLHREAVKDNPFADLGNVAVERVPMRGDRLNLWERVRLPVSNLFGRPDLFHTPSGLSPRFPLARMVATLHDVIPLDTRADEPDVIRWGRNVRRTAQKAVAVITASEHAKSRIIHHCDIPPEKVHVVQWGPISSPPAPPTPDELRRVREQYGTGPDRPYVLHFGMGDPRKNTARVIEAWGALPEDVRRRAGLVVVGVQGPALDRFREQARAAGVGESARVHGYAPEDDVKVLTAGATAICYPTLYEGFGLPLLDAFAAGVPILTGNSTSLPEVAGDAALMVDATDARAIAAGLARLLTDEGFRGELVARGTRRVAEYTWERCAEQVAAVFERAAAR